MSLTALESTVNAAFDARDGVIDRDQGRGARRRRSGARTCSTRARPASPSAQADGKWKVNQWLKKAVLLSFRLNDMSADLSAAPAGAAWWDKVPSKFEGWGENRFRDAGFRAVPGRDRAPLGLHRPERRADAVLRQSRRLCR